MRLLRNWKNWLFPVLTVLIVAGLALLPLRLSVLEDGRLTGVVHAEELGEDSNFPARTPDLPGRVWLLAQRESLPEALAIMDQELEGAALEKVSARTMEELGRLEEAGVLPVGFSARLDTFSGNRVCLRDRTDLTSAVFWEVNSYERKTGEFCWLYLDGETGRVLGVEAASRLLAKRLPEPEEAGRAFLEGLGLEGSLFGSSSHEAGFRLADGRTMYWAVREEGYLRLAAAVDWEALDRNGGVSGQGAEAIAGGSVYDG